MTALIQTPVKLPRDLRLPPAAEPEHALDWHPTTDGPTTDGPIDVRLTFVFNVARYTLLQGGPFTWNGVHFRPEGITAPNQIVYVMSGEKAPPHSRNLAEMLSFGERPELVKLVIERGDDQVALVSRNGSCLSDADYFWVATSNPSARAFGPAEYVDALAVALETRDGRTRTPYRRFFFELDCQAEPHLRTRLSSNRCDDLERNIDMAVGKAVRGRWAQRLREQAARPLSYTPYRYAATYREQVGFVSELFLQLLTRHFATARGNLDFERLGEAFELFVNGELRLYLPGLEAWTTQPSSGSFLLFAEFALLAVECGVQPEVWTRIANVFVRTQRAYCRVYAPHGDPGPWKRFDYTACNYDEDRTLTPREMSALRKEFEGLSFEELAVAAAHHACRYMPGELEPS